AEGDKALYTLSTGTANTAVGYTALRNDTSGSFNTAMGRQALFTNTAGGFNTAVGNTALSLNTGNYNTAIGDSTLNDNTSGAGNREPSTGNADAIAVVIDSAGQLGTVSSSARFKQQIKPMEQTSEAILALKPVVFCYKNDRKAVPQFGLIAEEVAKVDPDLVV